MVIKMKKRKIQIMVFALFVCALAFPANVNADVCPTAGMGQIDNNQAGAGNYFAENGGFYCWVRKDGGGTKADTTVFMESYCSYRDDGGCNCPICGPNWADGWDRMEANIEAINRGECGCPTCETINSEPTCSDCEIEEEEAACYGDKPKLEDATEVAYGKKVGVSKNEVKIKVVNGYVYLSSAYKYEGVSEKNCKIKNAACYCDKATLKEASECSYGYRNDISDTKYPYELSNVSKDSCKKEKEIKKCVPEIIPGVTKTISNPATCEKTAVQTHNADTIKCDTSVSEGVYSIDCETEISTTFDMGNDNSLNTGVLSIYPGQGFGYKVKASIVKKCTGKFDADSWNTMYDTIKKKRDKETVNSKEWYKQNNKLEDLNNVVEYFQNWKTEVKDEPKISVKVFTNPVINISSFTSKLIQDGNSSSNLKKATKPLKLSNGKTIYEFTYSNASNPRIIEYEPPEVVFDKNVGTVSSSSAGNVVKGGNKIYTDMSIKPGTYKMTIIVSGVQGETLKNENCSFKVLDEKDITYRIVDVSNPFINKDYQKGNNWLNGTYNFTGVIDKNIWSKKSLYEVDLPSSEISNIQKSNKHNSKIANCDEKNKDATTKKICDIFSD